MRYIWPYLKNNDNLEFIILENYSYYIDNLLSQNEYISRKKYLTEYTITKNVFDKLQFMYKERILPSWCKQNKVNLNKLNELIIKHKTTDKLIKTHNDSFVNQHLKSDLLNLLDSYNQQQTKEIKIISTKQII